MSLLVTHKDISLWHPGGFWRDILATKVNVCDQREGEAKAEGGHCRSPLKVIENIAATLKGRALEQNRLCGKFATQQIREQIFLK